jgi:hypothetical protein
MAAVLTRRALNRALVARQMLVSRVDASPLEVIERLVGIQAQQARPPFVGLWSRISGFQRQDLRTLLESGDVVRATLMRATLHLMSRRDYFAFRPVLQPMLSAGAQSILRDRMQSFDLAAVLAEGRRLFAERPRTFTEVRAALVAAFPEADERAMGYAVRLHLPLILTPEEHDWSYRADGDFGLIAGWSDEPVEAPPAAHALVLRYLAAFGPASTADVQAWSAMRGLAPVLEDLRPQLQLFRDERKRDLFDLPEAPRPPEELELPARFVADFDNLVLSHADRTRVIADAYRPIVVTKNGLVLPTILVDGFVAGTWKTAATRKTATLTITPFEQLPQRAREELEAEAEGLLRFIHPEVPGIDLRFEE